MGVLGLRGRVLDAAPGGGSPVSPERTLRGYTMVRELGRTVGASLHLARRNIDGRDVGLQFLDPELAAMPGFPPRLAGVAAQVGPLRHPRVVGTDEVVVGDRVAALVVEPVVGIPLSALLEEGVPLSPTEAMVVIDDVLRGVGAAHAAGIVHCGICPERILLPADGEARLDGFALARAMALTGGEIGAPIAGYSSPERLGGVLPDGFGDLWASAALAHRLLTGRTPRAGAIAPVESLPAVTAVLVQALAADPQRRLPTAAALRTALTEAAAETLGPDWRRPSVLAARLAPALRPQPTAAPSGAWTEPRPAPSAPPPPSARAVVAGAAAPPAAAALPTAWSAPPAEAPVTVSPRHRGRTLLAAFLVLVLLAGAGVTAAVLLSRGTNDTTASAPIGPLTVVGSDIKLDVRRMDSGTCTTDYVASASAPLTGQGNLTYHWEQSGAGGGRLGDQTIPITTQPGFNLVEHFGYQGHRTGQVTFTFVLTAPRQQSVSKVVDVTC